MTVYFHTPTSIDLRALHTMGLSAKPETDSPIGEFGTGLKYAIAILLRENQRVRLWIDGQEHFFDIEHGTFRGEPVAIPRLDKRPLPFTLRLGKGWELWQAFRELESNTRDEYGQTTTTRPSGADEGTLFAIDGDAFADVYAQRDKYFLPDSPVLEIVAGVEIRPGVTRGVYYRGILVHENRDPFFSTYNILNKVELTEDRTLKDSWTIQTEIGFAINNVISEAGCERMARSEPFYEAELAREGVTNELADALIARKGNPNYPKPWRDAIAKRKNAATGGYTPTRLSKADKKTIEKARKLLEPLSVPDEYFENLTWVEGLGEGKYGVYDKRASRVYISRDAINEGATHLAGTLFEEYAHQQTGFRDKTREFQDYLLRRLINLAERTVG